MRTRGIVLSILTLVLCSCAVRPAAESDKLYWPPPPALPRLVYEATLRNAASLKIPTAETRLQALATNQARDGEPRLIKPYDVAARQGLVIVSDTTLGVVHVFDLPRQKLFAIGWRGKVRLVKPLGVTLDAQLNIYVADAGLRRVIKFDRRGHYIASIGQPEDFSRLIDVAVSPVNQQVYALDRGGVDSGRHRVQVYAADGRHLSVIGRRGTGPGQFNHPVQIAVGSDGRIYVLDAGNFRVQVFSPDGRYLTHWGRLGKFPGDFARPRGLAVSQANLVFVTDSAFQNFQIFDEQGQILLAVGEGGGPDLPARYSLPAGIAVDDTNRVYVVDQLRRKLEVFRLLSDDEIEKLRP